MKALGTLFFIGFVCSDFAIAQQNTATQMIPHEVIEAAVSISETEINPVVIVKVDKKGEPVDKSPFLLVTNDEQIKTAETEFVDDVSVVFGLPNAGFRGEKKFLKNTIGVGGEVGSFYGFTVNAGLLVNVHTPEVAGLSAFGGYRLFLVYAGKDGSFKMGGLVGGAKFKRLFVEAGRDRWNIGSNDKQWFGTVGFVVNLNNTK